MGWLRRAFVDHPTLSVALCVHAVWIVVVVGGGLGAVAWSGWPMAVTMAFGSFIAGATSEGGGAVAFPVMTLVLGIPPAVARDFALMIQSVGMTAAAWTIVATRTPVRSDAIPAAALGGAVGMVAGLGWIAPFVAAPVAKLFFTSLWLSFGVALWLHQRQPVSEHEVGAAFGPGAHAGLFGVGVIGGIVGSITGSGLDLLTFSVLVLRFGVSERLGTPTSVVLMASNAVVGAVAKGWWLDGIEPAVWSWWLAAVPVVVVGAPLGARFVRVQPRRRIVGFLLVSIVVQFVASVVIVPANTPRLIGLCAVTFLTGAAAFLALAGAGRRALATSVVEHGA